MVLNFGDGEDGDQSIFLQTDVRETPASTATATSVGLTDGKYIVVDYHADMTAERKITAGEGIDFTDNGANSTFLIAGEDSTAANKGIVIVSAGNGISVGYVTGTATITNSDHAAVGLNTTHRGLTNNPHTTTKSHVGLSSVPNTDFTTPVASNTTHRGLTNDPHSVTKAQVGLGNVTNNAQVTSVAGGTGLTSSGGTTPSLSLTNKTSYLPLQAQIYMVKTRIQTNL